jgi:hypothetical protein
MSTIILQRDASIPREALEGLSTEELQNTAQAMIQNIAMQFLKDLPQFMHVSFDYKANVEKYFLSAEIRIDSPHQKYTAPKDFSDFVNKMNRRLPPLPKEITTGIQEPKQLTAAGLTAEERHALTMECTRPNDTERNRNTR